MYECVCENMGICCECARSSVRVFVCGDFAQWSVNCCLYTPKTPSVVVCLPFAHQCEISVEMTELYKCKVEMKGQ